MSTHRVAEGGGGSLLTLVTTCKNRLHHLQRTLPLMLEQSFSEVVVVDYGCDQGTSEWVSSHHGDVKCMRVTDDPRFSLSRARNIGATAAQTEYLCFIDADVILKEDLGVWIAEHCTANAFYLSGTPEVLELSGFVICRKADFDEIGGYDEVFKGWGGEDKDLYDRFRLLGLKSITLPPAALKPIQHGDNERALGKNDPNGFTTKGEALAITQLYRNIKLDMQILLKRELEPEFRRNLFHFVVSSNSKAISSNMSSFKVKVSVPVPPERNAFSRSSRTLVYEVPVVRPGEPIDQAPTPVIEKT